MPGHDIVVIGASAGGIEALGELARGLPPDLPAAVFAVIHIGSQAPEILPNILNRNSTLPVIGATQGARIVPGRMYIAPPDHHLLLAEGHTHINQGPRENNVRPAIDPLFRSAALAYGARVIGVIMTGNLDDGTAGLLAIRQRGGITIVQDPAEAMFPGMPRSAIENVDVNYIAPLAQLPALITQLVAQPVNEVELASASERIEIENQILESGVKSMKDMEKLGAPSPFTCPECGGALYEVRDENLVRYRCHTGHAFSAESLDAEQAQVVEETMWAALRALQESIDTSRRIAARARQHHDAALAEKFEEKAKQAQARHETLKKLLRSKHP